MSEGDLDRRRFLRAGTGSAGLALLACAGCGQGASEPSSAVSAGNVSALAVDDIRVVDGPLVLARDSGGLYAMSAICPHAGCPVNTVSNSSAAGLVCRCHGSRFDADGQVTRGPARSPLTHYPVEIDAQGAITIRADLPPVSPDVRTPVA